MESNELRVGNYIKDRGNKILKIDWMDEHKVNMKMFVNFMEVHPMTEEYEYCQPIILTEEWLEKFGFRKYSSVQWDRENFWNIEFKRTGCYWCNQLEIHIQYVHQLQNLYYALTGEELQPSRLEKPGA